jgi:hypothetical protein
MEKWTQKTAWVRDQAQNKEKITREKTALEGEGYECEIDTKINTFTGKKICLICRKKK